MLELQIKELNENLKKTNDLLTKICGLIPVENIEHFTGLFKTAIENAHPGSAQKVPPHSTETSEIGYQPTSNTHTISDNAQGVPSLKDTKPEEKEAQTDPVSEPTLEDVRDTFFKLATTVGPNAPKAILATLGMERLAELEKEDYIGVIKMANEKMGVK